MTGRFATHPTSTARTSEGIPSEGTHKIILGLHIEEDLTVPVPLIQLALDTTGPQTPGEDHIKVVATNWEASAEGARAIASFLQVSAEAIIAELDKQEPPTEIGKQRPGSETYADVMKRAKPGETIRDVERREASDRREEQRTTPRFNPTPAHRSK